jgi:hypothetical protein
MPTIFCLRRYFINFCSIRHVQISYLLYHNFGHRFDLKIDVCVKTFNYNALGLIKQYLGLFLQDTY